MSLSPLTVSIDVATDGQLDDGEALEVGERWAAAAGLELDATSQPRGLGSVRVAGTTDRRFMAFELAQDAARALVVELRRVGAAVLAWEAVDVSGREVTPLVPEGEAAALAGVESVRLAVGFPAAFIDGWWMRADVTEWASR